MKKTLLRGWLVISLAMFALIGDARAQDGRPVDLDVPKTVQSAITPEESQQRLKDAIALFEAGKQEAALYALQQLEAQDPTNYEVLFKLGELAIAAKNWAYAIQVLAKAAALRPKDVEVRLIQMDIYRAYQMPIQEIMAGKEIMVLDPDHVTAATRLANLYQEEGMVKDETEIRKTLMRLAPKDYNNLRRLAYIYDEGGLYWEATRIYEKIRAYYPDKIDDIRRLAALYGKLAEYFREHEVLDFLEKHGGGKSALRTPAMKATRISLSAYNTFQSDVTVEGEQSDDIDRISFRSKNYYKNLRVLSSIDYRFQANYDVLKYTGKGLLGGNVNINSGEFWFGILKNWRHQDFQLEASAGVLRDDVFGRLFAMRNTDLDSTQLPFLRKRAFETAGGTKPLWKLSLTARPGLRARYSLTYERKFMDDFDARLRQFEVDQAMLNYMYQTPTLTKIGFTMDANWISDGNLRLHGKAGASYVIWGSGVMRDRYGKRKRFIDEIPPKYIQIGYDFEFIDDDQRSIFYEVYEKEMRHRGILDVQWHLKRFGLERNLFFQGRFSYGKGKFTTRETTTNLGLFFDDPETRREFSILYQIRSETVKSEFAQNQLFEGEFSSSAVFAQFRFNL